MTQVEEKVVRNSEHKKFYEKLLQTTNKKEVVELLKSKSIVGYSKYTREEIIEFFKYVSPLQVYAICSIVQRKPNIEVAKDYLDFSDIKGMEKEIEKIFEEGEVEYEGEEFRDINFLDLNVYNEEEDETYYATGANADLNGRYENYGTCDEESEESEEGISGFCPNCRIDMDGEKHGLPFCTDCGMIRWADGSYSYR